MSSESKSPHENSPSSPLSPLPQVSSFTNLSTNTTVNPFVLPSPPLISSFTLNESISTSGAFITNQQGLNTDGNSITYTTFSTITSAENDDITINQDLRQIVTAYYDNTTVSTSETMQVIRDIQGYASTIQCTSFHGKGTIDDYTAMFEAAAKIANDTKQMNLVVDISGFNEFGAAADELSSLFTSFITKLQSINIIDDLDFLKSVRLALSKISNLVNVFGTFKQTILATASVEIPKSAHDARLLVEGVVGQVNCAMKYIAHFVDGNNVAPPNAELSETEKNIISSAVKTIDHWQALCDLDATVSMNNNPDIVYMKSASRTLHAQTASLRYNISSLRSKISGFNNM